MRIASLHTYPLKGGHRLDHHAVAVEPWGLAGDRRWMLVDDDGVGITQRDDPRLSLLRARPRPGGLIVTAPGHPDLDVDEPVEQPDEFVRVFRSQEKLPARIAESRWVSAVVGRSARLAWQADPAGRPVPDWPDGAERVSLADGYPILLANAASLAALNDWLVEAGDEAIPMTRFRPNLVVAGAEPWAEDGWAGRRLRIGDVPFRAADGCARCVVTTIDQETGRRTGQPLKMLGRHRRFDEGLLFALNLVPEGTGILRSHDPVTLS